MINTKNLKILTRNLSNRFLENMKLSFFCDIILQGDIKPEDFDNLMLADIKNVMDKATYKTLETCALEFICTSEFPEEEEQRLWNIIDEFLQENSTSLSDDTINLYTAFRDSYMGLYEVIKTDAKQTLLKDIIDKNQPDIVVQGKISTLKGEKIVVGNRIGARILNIDMKKYLTESTLLLSKSGSDIAKAMIKMMTDFIEGNDIIQEFGQEFENSNILLKKMWAKDIAQNWYIDLPEDKKIHIKNIEGHDIQFFTLQFPVQGSESEIIEKLNNTPETGFPQITDNWELSIEVNTNEVTGWTYTLPVSENKPCPNSLILETLICGEDPEDLYICAEINLEDQHLIVQVNSKERIESLTTFIKATLGTLVGNPKIDNRIQLKEPDSELDDFFALTGMEEEVINSSQKMMESFIKEQINEFIEKKVPDLGNLSPREAINDEKLRHKVISVLSLVSRNITENFQKQFEKLDYKYDASWLWDELGVKTEELTPLEGLYEKMKLEHDFL